MRRLALTAALLAGSALPALAQEAPPGQRVFRTQCGACHALEAGKNGVGPSLHGIVGRPMGSIAGFRYSANIRAEAEKNTVWTEETLRTYIANPKSVLPNGNMPYAGLRNPQQLDDLVAFLKTQG
jgi:cytochrome c